MHVWKVARYTCSSPLYFGEYDNYIDTSVLCKNLCGVALEKINSFYAGFQNDSLDPISVVVSLGDGILPAQQLGVAGPLSTYYLGSNPKLRNAKELLSVFQNLVTLYTSAAVSNVKDFCSVHLMKLYSCCISLVPRSIPSSLMFHAETLKIWEWTLDLRARLLLY